MERLVYGVGFDSGGVFYKTVNRKHTKSYSVWKDMLRRGYSVDYKNKHTSYKHVEVCTQWHDYQVFAKWFHEYYRSGTELDKDILGDGTIYSPKTCRFIPKDLNILLVHTRYSTARNQELPLGVSKSDKGYTAYCNDGCGKTINLGTRQDPDAAFILYKSFKESLIKTKAEKYFKEGVIDLDTKFALLYIKIEPYFINKD